MSDEFDENDGNPGNDDKEPIETPDVKPENKEPIEEQTESDEPQNTDDAPTEQTTSDDVPKTEDVTTDQTTSDEAPNPEDGIDEQTVSDEVKNNEEAPTDQTTSDEVPKPDDVPTNTDAYPEDESQLSPTELLERGERERDAAQKVAEEWADHGAANRWSDGSIRQGHENDSYYRTTNQVQELEDEIRSNQQKQEASLAAREMTDETNNDFDESTTNNDQANSFIEQDESSNSTQSQDVDDTTAEEEYNKLKEQYEEADREMMDAKKDMNWAKSDEEKYYWFKRSQDHLEKRDDAMEKMTSYEQKNKK